MSDEKLGLPTVICARCRRTVMSGMTKTRPVAGGKQVRECAGMLKRSCSQIAREQAPPKRAGLTDVGIPLGAPAP